MHKYLLMDARARRDTDDAIVYEVCHTFEEAKREAPNHGDDTAIVKCDVVGGQLQNLRVIQ